MSGLLPSQSGIMASKSLANASMIQRISFFSCRNIKDLCTFAAVNSDFSEVASFTAPLLLKKAYLNGARGDVFAQAVELDLDFIVQNLLLYLFDEAFANCDIDNVTNVKVRCALPLLHRMALCDSHRCLSVLVNLAKAFKAPEGEPMDEETLLLADQVRGSKMVSADFFETLAKQLFQPVSAPVFPRSSAATQPNSSSSPEEEDARNDKTPEKQTAASAAAAASATADILNTSEHGTTFVRVHPVGKGKLASTTGPLTPAHLAAIFNRPRCLRLLLELAHTLTSTSEEEMLTNTSALNQNSPAHLAASHDSFACLRVIAEAAPKALTVENASGTKPLAVAAATGSSNAVRWILAFQEKYGSERNLTLESIGGTNKFQQSPLSCARNGGCDKDVLDALRRLSSSGGSLQGTTIGIDATLTDPRELLKKVDEK